MRFSEAATLHPQQVRGLLLHGPLSLRATTGISAPGAQEAC